MLLKGMEMDRNPNRSSLRQVKLSCVHCISVSSNVVKGDGDATESKRVVTEAGKALLYIHIRRTEFIIIKIEQANDLVYLIYIIYVCVLFYRSR